jgi:nicotinamide riboside kinase
MPKIKNEELNRGTPLHEWRGAGGEVLKKIVIIGPESTGKSTLCEKLAAHYQTQWCPEFAREYLLEHGTGYSYDDLLIIAKGQLALEDRYSRELLAMSFEQPPKVENESAVTRSSVFQGDGSKLIAQSSKLLFLDTDMYVMKVWCEFVFGQCHDFILDEITKRKYDLYLLCKPDLPWVKDELREYPDLETRDKLYHIYKDLLINQETPWVEISGGYDVRLEKAIVAVDGI